MIIQQWDNTTVLPLVTWPLSNMATMLYSRVLRRFAPRLLVWLGGLSDSLGAALLLLWMNLQALLWPVKQLLLGCFSKVRD